MHLYLVTLKKCSLVQSNVGAVSAFACYLSNFTSYYHSILLLKRSSAEASRLSSICFCFLIQVQKSPIEMSNNEFAILVFDARLIE